MRSSGCPPLLTHVVVCVALPLGFPLSSPQNLWDGKHEGVVEHDAQRDSQEVRAKLARQRPEQEEPGALLPLQLPEELRLVGQLGPQRGPQGQGLLLSVRGRGELETGGVSCPQGGACVVNGE